MSQLSSTQQHTAQPLISVIMAAYNVEAYICDAIGSVRSQTWPNWQLVVVDDGSSDRTSAILDALNDARILVLHQANKGVSAARNAALEQATGAFIAFLDADDILPPRSLEARASLLVARPELYFVDGTVLRLTDGAHEEPTIYEPHYQGFPFDPLIALQGSCFFGNTWMIRRTDATDKRFPTHMRHGEDLAFYLSIAQAGLYDHVHEPVLRYRQGHVSAMSDLKGLERGYRQLYAFAQGMEPAPSLVQLSAMRSRLQRIMFRSYLKQGMLMDALRMKFQRFKSA